MNKQNQTNVTNIKKGYLIEFTLKRKICGYKKPTMAAPVEILNADNSCWVVTIAGWLKIEPEEIKSVTCG